MRHGEIWEFNIDPIGCRIFYLLTQDLNTLHWYALVLYDDIENNEGTLELLSLEEISGDLFYWTQLF